MSNKVKRLTSEGVAILPFQYFTNMWHRIKPRYRSINISPKFSEKFQFVAIYSAHVHCPARNKHRLLKTLCHICGANIPRVRHHQRPTGGSDPLYITRERLLQMSTYNYVLLGWAVNMWSVFLIHDKTEQRQNRILKKGEEKESIPT